MEIRRIRAPPRQLIATKPKPSEIFARFCEAFVTHTFPKDKESWQDEIVRIFKEIGQRFTLDVDTEFLRTDLIWYQEFPIKSLIELVLEHENHTCHAERSFRENIIPEVDKLRNVKALQKWLVYYPRSEDLDLHLSRIAQYALSSYINQDPREEWLVLTLTDDSEAWVLVQASLHFLTSGGTWQELGVRQLKVKYA